jgi:alanyl-tRNA synthetase
MSEIMLNLSKLEKNELRKEFAKDYKSYYSTKIFDEQGFERRKCNKCGKNFWSIERRDSCDDPEHTPYSFFKEKPRPIGYVEFWKKFAKFFSDNGHAVIDRYPVVSRWRQDLYFTIASIQDFQRIENGAMGFEYSANPLIVPQICLRFPDIENVGVTGRHFTSFMMAGQHSFNYPKEGYWRDRTIELNYKFLTGMLGVKRENLLYNEDVWAMGDFSEFGPCLESFSNGVELVNSVFTQFESVNGKAKELPDMVVDVGWGFERLMWFYTGFDNAYDAVFHDVIEKSKGRLSFELEREHFKKFAAYSSELDVTEKGSYREKVHAILKKTKITESEYEKKIRPMQAFYATLDHARTLLFAISDGALPSNIGGGYNLRVILRRALSFMSEYKIGLGIMDIAEMEAKELKGLYPELKEHLDILSKVIDIESARYAKTTENASRIINTLIAKKEKIGKEQLKTLYESNGITPELISAVASKEGIKIDLPEGAYEDIIKGDFAEKKKMARVDISVDKFPKTEPLYYKFATESDSKVLHASKNYIILDETPFYPEGGGQESDHGKIGSHEVVDVQRIGNVIVHITKEDVGKAADLKEGKKVNCLVDLERRNRLTAHHTSTHLMSAAARSVIGKHAWQEGTRKSYDKAHIDIAHYDKLGDDEVNGLEKFVNGSILNGIKVTIEDMERGKAEGEFGFSIYQGHGMPTKKMRMVIIRDKKGELIDAEACGGLHVAGKEYAIGMVKIINTARISDGVDRIEFVAGNAALDYFNMEHKELSNAAEVLNADRFKLVEKEIKLKEENSALMKRAAEKEEKLADLVAEEIYSKYVEKSKKTEISIEIDEPREVMRKALSSITKKNDKLLILARNRKGDVVCVRGSGSKKNAVDFARSTLGARFKGGGSESFAEGVATN